MIFVGNVKDDIQACEKEAPHDERKESVAESFFLADALKVASHQALLNSDDDSDGSEGLPDLVDDDDDDYNDEALNLAVPERTPSVEPNDKDEILPKGHFFGRPSSSLPRSDALYTAPSGMVRFSLASLAQGSSAYDISLFREFKRIPRRNIVNDAGDLFAEGEGILGPFGRAFYTPDAKCNFLELDALNAHFDVNYNSLQQSYIMPITKEFTAVFKHSRIDYKLFLCDIPLWIFNLKPEDNILCTVRSRVVNPGIMIS